MPTPHPTPVPALSQSASPLAAPLRLPGGALLPNRIAKSAMSEGLARPDDAAPNERHARLYERWGGSGGGLLITGNVMVSRDGRAELGNVVVEDERHLPALRRWADAAQAQGARLWMQINHGGRQIPRTLNPRPVAPSAVGMASMKRVFATPRAMGGAEVGAMVERFARTAAVARAAGFSGVQIHGAHGYLVSQFLSPLSNLRDDDWGGDPQRRMRFLLEIVRATRRAVGADFAVSVKLNSADFQKGGFSFDDAADVVRALEREGVDLIEVSGGTYEAPAMVGGGRKAQDVPAQRASTVAREAYFLEAAKVFRAATRVPLMLTGGMRSARGMAEALESGAVDVAGIARPMASEPALPARLLADPEAAARPVRLATGIRKLDSLLEIYWHMLQLHRMGDGQDVDPGLSRFRAILHAVAMTWTHRPKKTPAGPTVAAPPAVAASPAPQPAGVPA